MGKTIWEVFQEETGVHFYLYCQKGRFHQIYFDFLEEKNRSPIKDNPSGIFISKNPLYDLSGNFIGNPSGSKGFTADSLDFEKYNEGKFMNFENLVFLSDFGKEWSKKFKKEFFPFGED